MNVKNLLKKPTKQQVKKFLLNSLFIVLGNLIAAAAAAFFLEPNHFGVGGVTGIGILAENIAIKYFDASESAASWVFNITTYAGNILLFIVGAILLGKKFAVGTLAGTLLYPGFLTLFKLVSDFYIERHGAPLGVPVPVEIDGVIVNSGTGSLFLAAFLGSALFGLGLGIVVRVGASTGGTDIPALIMHKYFNTPISACLWIIDSVIVGLQFVATEVNLVLYGVVVTILLSIFVEIVSPIGMKRTQVKIISNRYLEIRDMILTKLDRGVTILYGQTGYLEQDCHVVLTVISNRQLNRLKSEVEKIDPTAFMTISVVSEVRGRGFRSDGVDFLMHEDKSDPTIVPPSKNREDGDGTH